MSKQYYQQVIEQLLRENGKQTDDVHKRLAWQRGYLTGLLSRLADDDSYVGSSLRRMLKENKKKK